MSENISVLGRNLFDTAALVRAERRVQRLGDAKRDIALNRQHAGERPMRIVPTKSVCSVAVSISWTATRTRSRFESNAAFNGASGAELGPEPPNVSLAAALYRAAAG